MGHDRPGEQGSLRRNRRSEVRPDDAENRHGVTSCSIEVGTSDTRVCCAVASMSMICSEGRWRREADGGIMVCASLPVVTLRRMENLGRKRVAFLRFFSYNEVRLLPLDQLVKREIGEAGKSLVLGLCRR
jgi:hypothetical protein